MARVLLVEDEANLRLLYRDELETEGYEVSDVGTGAEALKVLEYEKIDAVVLDLRLPDYYGLQLLDDILRRQRDLPVIINTAYDQFRYDFHSWGAEAFVVKSSDLSELKEVLARTVPAAAYTPL
ncbi:MAG: response regulator [candidate division KSB1 bacterium]|nr:response regulator [candidate division KSB1 bacterium]MDZ7368367.1 response regulator [candidate division KSB1 bacterium]MDZ7403087.1 response regulator [candidate division KSB1 bacterium]